MRYTSCFIGIPLPEEFVEEFRKAAEEVLTNLPGLIIADTRTPHITLYYLDEQSQLDMETVETKVAKHINLLAGSKIEVGRSGLFGGEKPRVVYVQAECSEQVYKFHDEISEDFKTYRAVDNDFGFVPHITLARIKESDTNTFLEHQGKISNILEKVSLGFEVQEVCVYGVDSRIMPERQTKLLTITI
ncbi:MAG: RNA 2',3'-cyclic phosphodiesterase [Candidatus Saccharimonadales bacterium]